MSFIYFNYGTNWNWDPNQFPNQKVSWDGYNKIIYVNEGVTTLDIKKDIYSAWKEWVLSSPEYPTASTWPEAISAIGGEPLNDTLNVGSTFFLENGWRIQPVPSSVPYILTVEGNIFTREAGGNPFLFAEGVSVNLLRSNIVDQVVATSTITETDYSNIAQNVWQYGTINNTGSATYGRLVKDIDSDLTEVKVDVDKTLKKGEFLALK
jgi:hypothetical protein